MAKRLPKKIAKKHLKKLVASQNIPNFESDVETLLQELEQQNPTAEELRILMGTSNGTPVTILAELDKEDLKWYRRVKPLIEELSQELPPNNNVIAHLDSNKKQEISHLLNILNQKTNTTISLL